MSAKAEHRAALSSRARTPRCALRHRGSCHRSLQADHVIEIAWLDEWLKRSRFRGEPIPCLACGGRGQIPTIAIEAIPVCCGNFRPDGECCGVPVPEPVEIPDVVECVACGATGAAELDTVIADARNGWWLCERHHGLKTAGLIRPPIERRELPPTLDSFCVDYRCAHLLDGRAAFARLA